jgi:CDP-6-deoxy-D-xylo-4-hexulose-3-dehydrase
LTVKDNKYFTRNDITGFLEKNLIETRVVFAGNILRQPGFKNIQHRIAGELKNADDVMFKTFFIGVYPGLTGKHLDYVEKTFESFINAKAGKK